MNSSAVQTRMTAEDFFEWVHRPEHAGRSFELVRGEVIELPPSTHPHCYVANNVGRLLGNHTFDVGRGYVLNNDAGVILQRDPDTVRGPDVAVYFDAEGYDDIHPKYGEGVPTLAVEVLSPTDRMSRVTRKITEYLGGGVLAVWLIDPEDKNLTVYRRGAEPRLVEAADVVECGDELPGFRCRVGDFFMTPADKKRQPTAEAGPSESPNAPPAS